MDDPNGPDDEITIDPFPAVRVPEWLAGGGGRLTRLTRRGRFLAAAAGVIVVAAVLGTLKLAGVMWTSAPPWASALGPGVTVTGPGPVASGHGSPGAAFAGFLAALSAKDPTAACDYLYLGLASRCDPEMSRIPRRLLPYGVSVEIGYVAIDGKRALLGFTGKICSPGATPRCLANTDPAAIFSTGKSFAALWTQALSPDGSPSVYTLLPCAEAGGKWYYGAGPAASGS
ncbi:MAG: hypothetical protein ACRDN0_12580 [Trebonia sp.]